jgi:hypothetical protein
MIFELGFHFGFDSSAQIVENFNRMKEDKAIQNRVFAHRLAVLDIAFKNVARQIKDLVALTCSEINPGIGGILTQKETVGGIDVIRTDNGHFLSVQFDAVNHEFVLGLDKPIQFAQTIKVNSSEDGSETWVTSGGKRVEPKSFGLVVRGALGALLGQPVQRW